MRKFYNEPELSVTVFETKETVMDVLSTPVDDIPGDRVGSDKDTTIEPF